MDKFLSYKIPGPDNTQIDVKGPPGIPSGSEGFTGKIMAWGIDLLLIVVVLLALGFIVWGGLNWVTSEGDKTKVESARKMIIYAVVGLIIAFLAFFAVQVLGGLFGFDLLKATF